MVEINVDFEFYEKDFGGNVIPRTDFNKYIQIAHLDLFSVISKNMYDVEEDEIDLINNIKRCECSLAEFEFKYGTDRDSEQQNTELGVGEVKSESAGSTSRTYVTTTEIYSQRINDIASDPQKFRMEIMNRYLSNTGLLYQGLK